MFWRRHYHWSFVWIPLFGSVIWFGTLLSMLVTWLASGRPKYPSQDGKIAYISDVGADILKPLFVTGCAITAVTFVLSLTIERLLRHQGRLYPTQRRRERVFAYLAILGSIIGGCGLLFLSIFDTKRYPRVHRIMLLVFMLGVALAAIFTVAEFRWISKDYVDVRKLKISYRLKGIIAAILVLLAIAFAVALFKNTDVGAVLEWTIAFGYTFFLLTFFYDLRQAKGAYRGRHTPEPDMRENRSTDRFTGHGAHDNGRHHHDHHRDHHHHHTHDHGRHHHHHHRNTHDVHPSYSYSHNGYPSAAYPASTYQPNGYAAGGYYPNVYQSNSRPTRSVY